MDGLPSAFSHRGFTLSLVSLPSLTHAQAIAIGSVSEIVGSRTASATTNNAGPSGIIPFAPGFNASLGTTSQFDSGNGWATILTSGVAFRFSPILSVDASVPIYASINVEANTGTKAKPVCTPSTIHGDLGDASIAASFATHPFLLDYNATLSIGLPSGNTAYGLGAGKTTYDFNNHVEKSFGIFSPDIEFGIGNSSSLIQSRVRKAYTSVGALAHFQAGTSIDLPLNLSFEADLYEVLPSTRPPSTPPPAAARRKPQPPPLPAMRRTTASIPHSTFLSAAASPSPATLTLPIHFSVRRLMPSLRGAGGRLALNRTGAMNRMARRGRRMFRISRTSLALSRRPTQMGDRGSLLIYRSIVTGPYRREWIGKTLNPEGSGAISGAS